MKKYITFLFCVFLALTTTASAKPISRQKALSIAKQAMSERSGKLRSAEDFKIVYSAENPLRSNATLRSNSSETSELFYVINCGERDGFIVVSGDDRVKPIFAYSDEGAIDADDLLFHPSVKALFEEYQRQMIWSLENIPDNNAGQMRSFSLPKDTEVVVEPLLNYHYDRKTKLTHPIRWGQDWPFNRYSPNATYTIHGKTKTYPTVSGCVATGISTVMRWHKWPEQPKGQITYYWKGRYKLSVNLDDEGTAYDWSNMPANVTASGYNKATRKLCNETESDNIGRLLRDVGYSVKMDYNPAFVGGSGTQVFYAPQALVEHFGYKSDVTWIERKNYRKESEWIAELTDELKNYGPIIYAGFSDDGGHCFVLDGIATDGYVHVDWGWNDSEDGWYLLNVMEPGSQGIGGGSGGYKFRQQMVRYLAPDRETPDSGEDTDVTADGSYLSIKNAIDNLSFYNHEDQTVSLSLQNNGVKAFKGTIGLALAKKGNKSANVFATKEILIKSQEAVTAQMNADFSELEQGPYDVYVAYRTASGQWKALKESAGSINIVQYVDPTPVEKKPLLKVVNRTEKITLTKGTNFAPLHIMLGNYGNADYSNNLSLYAIPPHATNLSQGYQISSGSATLKEGQSVKVTFNSNLSSVPVGTYALVVSAMDGENKEYPLGLVENEKSNNAGTLYVVEPKETPQQGSIKLTDAEFYQYGYKLGGKYSTIDFYGNTFTVRTYLKAFGDFAGKVRVFISKYRNGSEIHEDLYSDRNVRMRNGQEGWIQTTFNTKHFSRYTYYLCVQYYDESSAQWKMYAYTTLPFYVSYKQYDFHGEQSMKPTDGPTYPIDYAELKVGDGTGNGGEELSIEEPLAEEAVAVYPSVAKEFVTIETSAPASVEIFNVEGVKVNELTLSKGAHKVDVSDFASGCYFVKVEGNVYKFFKE